MKNIGYVNLNPTCRNLKAIITTLPGKEHLAIIEVGDAIFPHDPEVVIVRAPYPHVILVYSRLSSWNIYGLIIANPPASVNRIVPVEECVSTDINKILRSAANLLRRRLRKSSTLIHVSCTCRGTNLSKSEVEKMIALKLKEDNLAIPVIRFRDAEYELKVEVLGEITVLSLLPKGMDNVKRIIQGKMRWKVMK